MTHPPQPTPWAVELAAEMLDACRRDGQAARTVPAADDAATLRRSLVRMARSGDMRIRTALIEDVVAVVRTDAQIWQDDTPTMRAKLRPPEGR